MFRPKKFNPNAYFIWKGNKYEISKNIHFELDKFDIYIYIVLNYSYISVYHQELSFYIFSHEIFLIL